MSERFRFDTHLTLQQISEDFGIPYPTLRARVLKRGIVREKGFRLWLIRVEDVPLINEPVGPRRPWGSSKDRLKSLKGRWNGMKSRCYNPENVSYPDYGGRGITVCDEWLDSFDQFFQDMGLPPEDRPVLDREDNEKGYSKENCRWVDWQTSALNRRCTPVEKRK